MAHTRMTALSVLFLACSIAIADARGNFLGKIKAKPSEADVQRELEKFETIFLLAELEQAIGNEHRTYIEKRLPAIKKVAEPIFDALPKNEHGKLSSGAVSYALYRVFLARHAWFVIGLEPFKAMASWNATSPFGILEKREPDFDTDLFSTRLDKSGFGVHELAVLAGTLEHFVHKESLLRLSKSYTSLYFDPEQSFLEKEEVEKALDTYMALYILGPLVRNLSRVSGKRVRKLRANATRLYPAFPETQQFLREVQETSAPKIESFAYSDVVNLVEEVGDRYGRWQDYECRAIKNSLVDMEDEGPGGAGRVRLADFYNASLTQGKWQFSENVEYLRRLGALDESNPDNVRVIIANYVNGPSNCVASSRYYSVCCLYECDELIGTIEAKVAAPEASPEKIVEVVTMLPSSTMPQGRSLAPWLTQRLHEVAKHHGGLIPLHGRLFLQWLHYAYPRECTFPHVSGTTRPQTAEDWVRETRRDCNANKTEKEYYVSLPVPHQHAENTTLDLEKQLSVESAMWRTEEELLVQNAVTKKQKQEAVGPWARFVNSFGVYVEV